MTTTYCVNSLINDSLLSQQLNGLEKPDLEMATENNAGLPYMLQLSTSEQSITPIFPRSWCDKTKRDTTSRDKSQRQAGTTVKYLFYVFMLATGKSGLAHSDKQQMDCKCDDLIIKYVWLIAVKHLPR